MNQVVVAGLWGSLSGSALLIGAAIGTAVPLPQRIISAVMALGAGVLISALAFELMDEAVEQGGIGATAVGFAAGAIAYTLANLILSRRGARHRKRSGHNAQEAQGGAGSGLALAIGALLDGIPEAVVIGVSLLEGGAVGLVTVIAVFLSNVPEGLSSAAGMKRAGRRRSYIFGVWGGIALATGLAAAIGNAALAGAAPELVAAITAMAAGAILAMLVDTMVPEATESVHEYAGLIAAAGFLGAFALSRLAG